MVLCLQSWTIAFTNHDLNIWELQNGRTRCGFQDESSPNQPENFPLAGFLTEQCETI